MEGLGRKSKETVKKEETSVKSLLEKFQKKRKVRLERVSRVSRRVIYTSTVKEVGWVCRRVLLSGCKL